MATATADPSGVSSVNRTSDRFKDYDSFVRDRGLTRPEAFRQAAIDYRATLAALCLPAVVLRAEPERKRGSRGG